MLAFINVELRSWSTVVFLPVLVTIAYIFWTQPVWTFLVGAVILLAIGVALYYVGVRLDQRLRHGGGA